MSRKRVGLCSSVLAIVCTMKNWCTSVHFLIDVGSKYVQAVNMRCITIVTGRPMLQRVLPGTARGL